MSDRPENNAEEQAPLQGGWRQPSTPTRWRAATPQQQPSQWRRALPEDVRQEPGPDPDWHLPAPEDTLFDTNSQLPVQERQRPVATTPSTSNLQNLSPEDLLAEVMQQRQRKPSQPSQTASGPRPEDLTLAGRQQPAEPSGPRPEDVEFTQRQTPSGPRPEDLTFQQQQPPQAEKSEQAQAETSTDDAEVLPYDQLEQQAQQEADQAGPAADQDVLPYDQVEAALDEVTQQDAEEDAFSMGEFMALASLEQQAQQQATGGDDQAQAAADDKDKDKNKDKDEDEDTSDLSPAERALRTGQQQQQATAEQTGSVPGPGEEGYDPAAYARQQIEALRGAEQQAPDAGDTQQPEQTERFAPQQPQQPQLSPQQEALAQRFRASRDNVLRLSQMYDGGQISYDDFQAQQRQYMLQDNSGIWWAFGVQNQRWHQLDPQSNQWVEAEPPVPLDASDASDVLGIDAQQQRTASPPTATGELDPVEVLPGSLPLIQDSQQGEFSGGTQYDPAGAGGTPVPRVGQPQYDENATLVGDAAFRDTLQAAEPTVQNMQTVGQQGTLQSQTQPAGVGSLADAPAQQGQQAAQPARSYDEMQASQRSSLLRTLLLLVGGLIALGALVVGGIAAYIVFVWYPERIEPFAAQIASLESYQPDFQTARILDASGDLIVELNSAEGGAREPVDLSEMSPFLLHAVISSENASFYEDPGYSIPRIIGAFVNNLQAGAVVEGASTITQQVARSLVIQDRSTTADRKLTEILVATELAQNYSKNEILELYLNNTFFGNQNYGVEAAAQFYFDKPAAELNMAEGALLAAILNAPADNNPVVSTQRDQAFAVMRVVMERMIEVECLNFQHGQWADSNERFCINQQTTVAGTDDRLLGPPDDPFAGAISALIAFVEGGNYLPRDAQFDYPHFVRLVEEQLVRAYGADAIFQRGFEVQTTLVPRIQARAQSLLVQRVDQLARNGVNTGSVMVTDPRSGAVLALVGSPDFNDEEIDGQVDNTRTYQQPGSVIKPILYAAALEGGQFTYQGVNYMTPASILWDVESRYQVGNEIYVPQNDDGIYHGPTTLRNSLQRSYNVPAVKTLEIIGFDQFRQTAERLNVNFLQQNMGLSAALGANEVRLIDLMRAYGAIANSGSYVPLRTILSITDSNDNPVPLAPLGFEDEPAQVLSPQVAYLLQNILSDDNARQPVFGVNSDLTLSRLGISAQDVVGAKTGTTDGGRDLWTMGFTNNRVVGVWLGTVDDQDTVNLSGFTAAAPLWNRVLEEAIENAGDFGSFSPPQRVLNDVQYCADTGTQPYNGCPTVTTGTFMQGQLPPQDADPFVQTLQIDAWTGKIANNFCPNNVVTQRFADLNNDPFALAYLNNQPAGRSYAQRIGVALPLQQAPLASCQQGDPLPQVAFQAPSPGQAVEETVPIAGQATGPNFERWELAYASSQNPNNFISIGGATQEAVAGSQIAQWDTTEVANGQYTLRLTAFSQAGGEISTTIAVTVDNELPTPTPTLTPTLTPTATLIPSATPTLPVVQVPTGGNATAIPFDPVNPTPTATVGDF